MKSIESKLKNMKKKYICIYLIIYYFIEATSVSKQRRTANRKGTIGVNDPTVNHSSKHLPVYEAKKDIETSKTNSHFFSRNTWDRQFAFRVTGTVCILAILEAQ